MSQISFIILSFILTLLTMTLANPCPCEVIVSESLSNNPPTAITDSNINEIINDKLLEDYLEQLETSTESYPLLRQGKSLDSTGQRNKRPSWAAVGKRAASIYKRPSWAQVG